MKLCKTMKKFLENSLKGTDLKVEYKYFKKDCEITIYKINKKGGWDIYESAVIYNDGTYWRQGVCTFVRDCFGYFFGWTEMSTEDLLEEGEY